MTQTFFFNFTDPKYFSYTNLSDTGNYIYSEVPLTEINCFRALEYQLRTIFIVTFVKNIPELLVPFLKGFIRKKRAKADDTPILHPFISTDK